MKYICVLLTFIFSYTYGQDLIINYGKKPFYEAEVVLENGEVKKGFIQDFTMPNTFKVNTFNFSEFDFLGNKLINDRLGANKNVFKFKSTKEGEIEKIEGNDVSEITIIDKETFNYKTFKKLDIKRVSRKMEIVDGKDDLFLPLIRMGYYNIYGIPIIHQQGKHKYFSGVFVIFENPRTNFSINPIDLSLRDIINLNKFYEKYEVGMLELLKDCPEASEELKKQLKLLKNKKTRKKEGSKSIKMFKEFNKSLKQKLKSIPKKERDQVECDMWIDFYINLYTEGFKKMDEVCK